MPRPGLFSLRLGHCETPPSSRQGEEASQRQMAARLEDKTFLCLEFYVFGFNFISDAAIFTIHWS